MPNWNELLDEVKGAGSVHDIVRRKYVRRLSELTGRNTIIYYSGWLQKAHLVGPESDVLAVNDADIGGFMTVIHQMDRSRGLDLVLHTPGGSVAATEAVVGYLKSMFDNDIRAIVPQLALSAGTMIALACKSIVMGKHSSLGAIEPHYGGISAHGVLEEFEQARDEILANPDTALVWQPILAKYPPAFIGDCQKAITWAGEMVAAWLREGMFAGRSHAARQADAIVEELSSHQATKSHDRDISSAAAQALGLKIELLETEGNQRLQDAVLTVHHACTHTLAGTNAVKLIENQNGISYVSMLASAP
jgi:ATP-dependent protease ClpP protease subunit